MKNPKQHNASLVSVEKRHNYWLYASYLSLILSSLITWLWPVHNVFNQWLTMIHSVTGILFVAILVKVLEKYTLFEEATPICAPLSLTVTDAPAEK